MKSHTFMKGKTLVSFVALGVFALAGSSALAQEASTAYKGSGRDPFEKYKAPARRKVERKTVTALGVPSIQERIARYKAQKAAAMNLQQPAPKPTTAMLISEVQVTGIFRTPRGLAAMVEATPIKLSYVIYPGEPLFDGHLVAVEQNRLVFRRETKLSNGKREVSVENKSLRDPNAVVDSMTATRSSSSSPPSAEAGGKQKEQSASSSRNQ